MHQQQQPSPAVLVWRYCGWLSVLSWTELHMNKLRDSASGVAVLQNHHVIPTARSPDLWADIPRAPSDCVLFVSSNLNNNEQGRLDVAVFGIPKKNPVQSVRMCWDLSWGFVCAHHDGNFPAGDLMLWRRKKMLHTGLTVGSFFSSYLCILMWKRRRYMFLFSLLVLRLVAYRCMPIKGRLFCIMMVSPVGFMVDSCTSESQIYLTKLMSQRWAELFKIPKPWKTQSGSNCS